MKKTILIIAVILLAATGFSQNIIHTDNLTDGDHLLKLEWEWKKWSVADSVITTKLKLNKVVIVDNDTTLFSGNVHTYSLKAGDSIQNPNTQAWYTYNFVRNFIFNNGESFIYTLAEYQVRNDEKRFFKQ